MAYSYNPRADGESRYDSRGAASGDRDPYYKQFNYSSYDSRRDDGERQPVRTRPPPLTPPENDSSNSESWPPPPLVEDEGLSLSREHPPRLRTKSQDDGVQMRGAVDQDPVLVEAENRERRFVHLTETSKQGLMDEKSSDYTFRSEIQRPPPLKTNVDQPDNPTAMPIRQRSPYAFTPNPSQRDSGEYFLSPDSIPTSAAGASSYSARQTQPRRQDSSESSAARSRTETSDESDVDPQAALKERSKKKSSRVSFTTAGPSDRPPLLSPMTASGPSRSSRTPSPQYDAPPETGKRDSQRKRSPRATAPGAYGTQKPNPITKASRSDSMYSSSPTRHGLSRSVSNTVEPVWLPSPPRSPNLPSPRPSNDSPRNSLGSHPSSRPSSRPTSPVSVPLDEQPTSAPSSKASQKLKAARATSFGSSMRQEFPEELPKLQTDVRSPQPVRLTKSSSLPYPEDDHSFLMPTEADFSPAPRGLGVGFGLDIPARPHSAIPPSAPYVPMPKPSPRPDLPSRHTFAEGLPYEAVPKKEAAFKKESSPPSPLPILPPCPRKDSSHKHDDWYTILGCEALNVCPSCIDKIVLLSPFRKQFKRAPTRSSSARITCGFSSPWVRLAWLITIKQQRPNLSLLKELTNVEGNEAECPGAAESSGSMYGIALENGAFLPSFAVCPADRHNVETLFPSLVGCFTRLPSAVKIDKVCALRASSKRFPRYLDTLVAINDKAAATGLPALLTPLIDLANSFAYKHECQRDRILVDAAWHFPAAMPELTVCEECFDELVWPRLKKGSTLAERFSASLQPLPPGHAGRASCQLYSARMRRVWERAADKADWEYLKRKVRERRRVESELRDQQQAIMMMLTKGSGGYAGAGGVDKDKLKRELDRIELEWADWE